MKNGTYRGTWRRLALLGVSALSLAACGWGGAHEDRVRSTDRSTFRPDQPSAERTGMLPGDGSVGVNRETGTGGGGIVGGDSTLPGSAASRPTDNVPTPAVPAAPGR